MRETDINSIEKSRQLIVRGALALSLMGSAVLSSAEVSADEPVLQHIDSISLKIEEAELSPPTTIKSGIIPWYEKEVRTEPYPGTVAFTFDDGPHPKWTPYILDVLKEMDVKATFFVNGNKVDRFPEIAQRIVDEGHSLQNHSYDHANMTQLSNGQIEWRVDKGAMSIYEATGTLPTCLRPPFGATSARTRSIIEEHRHQVIIWDENSADYAHQSSQVLLNISHRWEDGEDVLMHDTNGYLYDEGILEQLIEEVRSRGLEFSTICENRVPPKTRRPT